MDLRTVQADSLYAETNLAVTRFRKRNVVQL
jgi:hypothetical protein